MTEVLELMLFGQGPLNEDLTVLSTVFILVGIRPVFVIGFAAGLLDLFARIGRETLFVA